LATASDASKEAGYSKEGMAGVGFSPHAIADLVALLDAGTDLVQVVQKTSGS
jgi:hypothetical protein